MEETQNTDVDDVDRESLVKEIELIRQTLGSTSTRAHHRAHSRSDGDFGSFDNAETKKDSDDSDDELAIIKSPEYRETSDEAYAAQHIPVVILSESEDEIEIATKKRTTPRIAPGDPDFSSGGNVTCQSSLIAALNNWENERDGFVKPVPRKQGEGTTSRQASPSPEQFDSQLDKTNDNDDYTLTGLQPAENNIQIPQGGCYLSSLDTADQNSNIGLAVLNVADDGGVSDDNQVVSLSDKEEHDELTEQQRCLRLNRKYQAIIEAQLRKIERLIAENKENQFRLGKMSSSSLTADEMELKHLASYNPYFRDTRKECPCDNEDTKLRKSLGQPHPYEKAPKPWSKEEKQILSDAAKSNILRAKLTPLLQRIDVISRKDEKTNEDENELEELSKQIDYIKTLPLLVLMENFTETLDFEDICNKMLPSRTSHQCMVFWYNELHPLLNKGKWAKDEDKSLLKLTEENSGGNWEKIACELKSNRSAVQCLRRFQKSLNKSFLKSKWEQKEDEKLKEAVRFCGTSSWEKVSSFLDGRTGPQCMHRYNKSLNPQIKRGKWEKEEDDLVRKGVELYGTNWIKFKSLLPTRTDAQIRERWQDVLNPELRREAWTKEEDEALLKIVQEQNVGLRNWSAIAKYIPGRTDNRCRRRWFILMKDDPKLKEHLSKQKITRAKLVNNFCRRRADKPNIGPEDFVLPELSENDETTSNTRLPRTSNEGGTEADAVTSEDGVASQDVVCTDGAVSEAVTSENCAAAKVGNAANASVDASKARSSAKTVASKARKSTKAVASKDGPSRDGNAAKTSADGAAAKAVTSSKHGTAAANDCAPANAETTESDKDATPTSSKRKAGKKQRGKKPKTGEIQTGKQVPSSKSRKTPSDVSSPDKQKRKKDRTKSTQKTRKKQDSVPTPAPLPQDATKVTSKSAEKPHAQRRKTSNKTRKSKLTEPSPVVVSQASCLPNRMPISLLTQFSVLLQAFHVDVSGVLKNVGTQGQATTSQQNSTNVAGTSSINRQTSVTTAAPKPTTRDSSVTSPVFSSSAGKIQNENTCVTSTPSSRVTHVTVCTKETEKVDKGSENQSVGVIMSNKNNNHITNSTTVNTSDTPESNASLYLEGNMTKKTMPGNIDSIPGNRRVVNHDSDDTGRNALEMSTVSNIEKSTNADTSSSSETTGKEDDTQEQNVRHLKQKRKRDNTNDTDVVPEKRMNGKESKDDDGVYAAGVNTTTTQKTTSKRKRDETTSRTARKRSNEESSEENTNEKEKKIRRHYPKRSNRGRSNNTLISTENKTVADKVTEPLPTSNVERDDSNNPRCSLSPVIVNNRYLHVRRVMMNTDIGLPQVPAIPPLPPSATTLSAFKKLLSLRKNLQSQATQPTSHDTVQNGQSLNESTFQNPCSDRLLLVSNTKTSQEGFRNSVAYQQLLNRFKGLFMWPGFLSIVNPIVGKDSEDSKKTIQTPKKKRRRRRQTR